MIWVKHVWFWLMERCQTHPSSRLKATKKVNQSGVLPKGKMQLRFFDNCFRKCCWDDDDVDVTETLHCTFDGFSNALYEQEWRRVIFEILAKLVYEHIQSLPGVQTKQDFLSHKSILISISGQSSPERFPGLQSQPKSLIIRNPSKPWRRPIFSRNQRTEWWIGARGQWTRFVGSIEGHQAETL